MPTRMLIKTFTAGCAVAALISFGITPSFNAIAEESTMIKEKVSKQNITLNLALPKQVPAARVVLLEAELHNSSKEKVYFGGKSIYTELEIKVIDNSGRPVALTDLGKREMGGDNEYVRYVGTVLEPGQAHFWKLDLSSLFLLNSGTYRVSISVLLNDRVPRHKGFELKKENIPIEIIEKIKD